MTSYTFVYVFQVKSLPMVIPCHSSQECAAKGTLLWDAAFSVPVSTLCTVYEYMVNNNNAGTKVIIITIKQNFTVFELYKVP